ncbi:ABC transporter substrate-binding protein [Halorarum halophilum]|uniref:ABC transporter substrate-binding protein n=1 Tax=Halorarum halophilum TaxID=2743090 RepID=A0A7D5GYF6_9EURY|nr:ABC transporter substrate-binding protein [Halobaculum halophilum]QLG26813.1 ABC transporter substrate-binding protein [Halobaculum halophilum]
MVRDIDRRDMLKSVGGAGVIGLAGCITQNGGNGDGNGDGNGGGDTPEPGDTGTDTPDDSGGESRTINHGVLMPVTGDLASLGGTIRDGAILPAAVLDGEDLPVTVNIQEEDTQTDPQAGVQAANSFASSGVPSVTGAASSAVSLQVYQQTFIPNGIVGCSPASTNPSISNLEDDNLIYRTCPSDALQGPVMAQAAAEKLGSSTASVMYVNNDYGQALNGAFVDAFSGEQGGTVQSEVAFEKEQSSYSSPLSNAMGGDPDLLVVIGYPASGIQIFRDFYAEYSADTDIMVTDGLRDGTLPDEVGNDMANVYGTSPLAQGPGTDAFNQQYQDEYGRAPGVFNAQAYDATAVCLLANAAAGENSGDAIKEQMRNVANPNDGTEITPANLAEGVRMAANGEAVYYQGASSNVDFDENGDMQAVTYEYFQFNTSVEGNLEQLDAIDFEA